MYQYIWDSETGGLLLTSELSKFSKEPRPVYWRELDVLGFDKYWSYPRDDSAPIMWAEANNYIYKGKTIARTKGGTIFTAPELIIVEQPELQNCTLHQVDVNTMVHKNIVILESITQEAIKKIYNVYIEYKKKVDVFYVAFSGGKDSIVTLDLVQRALPHNAFAVLFGDTRMEFSDTYNTVEDTKAYCDGIGIPFYTSRSNQQPSDTWTQFGPPSTTNRWCCSVHKTAPQILLLRNVLNKPDFTGMAFVGVRADESVARSKYNYVSFGEKHRGQFSCNAILDWNSAEVFLYIFSNKLLLNEAYKKGNRRAGCLICPRAAERNDFMNYYWYGNEAKPLVDIIRNSYTGTFTSQEAFNQFIEAGGWKARKNGRDLIQSVNYRETYEPSKKTILHITNPKSNWREWIKTLGTVVNDSSPYVIEYRGSTIKIDIKENNHEISVDIEPDIVREYPDFVKYLKNVFRKSACCIACKECQADCPYGCLHFDNSGHVDVSDNCHHCLQCHKPDKGCLVYKSLEMPKGGIIMSGKSMSLNSYSHHAPRMEWINQYFELKNEFDDNHSLGSQMYNFFKRFLRDAKLLDETGFSQTAQILEKIGLDNESAWGIMLVNLCYAPQVQWYVNNIGFDKDYSKSFLATLMVNDGAKENWTNDIFSSLVRLTELPLGKVGMGVPIREKNRATGLIRYGWKEPVSEVILYSLYKFAEACGGYYQFTLDNLLDDSIERDGVSPTRIFGLDKDTMVSMLNGLAVNYPDYISASFTHDLDNITLRSEKTSMNVLQLF